MVEILSATSEGPNTFWSKTVWESLERAREQYPENTYREKNGKVQWLLGKTEGDNTYWKFFDYGTVEEINKPASKKAVLRNCERIGDPENAAE